MKKHQFTLLLLVTLILPITVQSQDLIPLEIDNYWVYTKEVVKDNKIIETDTITSRVQQTKTYNSKKWFHLIELGDHFMVRNSKEGQYEIDTLDVDRFGKFRESLMFKKPSKREIKNYRVNDYLNVTIDNKRVTIKTTLGNFKCFKYQLIGTGFDENEALTIYIKPELGIVAHIWKIGDEVTTFKLIDYKLN